MPDVTTWTSLAPYHVLSYGTLLGSEIFQSFIGGVTAYKVLPRPSFSTLQAGVFPIYFGMQTAFPLVLALTYPGVRQSSFAGVFEEANRTTVLAPLGIMFVTGLANMAYFGPETTRVMKERKHQETRDGKKSYDPAPHSAEMQKLNKQFGKLHGISTIINMVGLGATIYYGGVLADRMTGRL